MAAELYYTDFRLRTSDHVEPIALVSRRGEDRIRHGHPWIYRSDVLRATAAPGDLVTVLGTRDRRLGAALWSDRSQIALRMVALGDEPVTPELWRQRLMAAVRFRESLRIDATAYRLVHGEADRLPALIVDRYNDVLVVQALSQAMDRRLPELTATLNELLTPRGILARNDPKVRALEGLEQRIDVLSGDVPDTVEVREGPVRYTVDVRHGQKTGLFLDQRENREAAARYARGRLLDCFSYNGGFALYLARHCDSVHAIDQSADAVARIAANAALNGLTNVTTAEANVFDELRHYERSNERFDTIVLDPPAFAKNKAAVEKAVAGYKDINLRALRILNPGGVLVTCSCSYNVDEPLFLEILAEAAADARAHVTILEKRMQGRDHPVLITVPETYYLKCVILRKAA
jgi:23S rRNA (cytosine1962-C5)-methyltransferase